MNFVTGGTGLVGMHLIVGLLKRGEHVRALYRDDASQTACKQFFNYCKVNTNQLQWVQGDILDMPLLESLVEGCHTVYHAAAVVSFHRRDRELMYEVNIQGTENVVNAALTGGCQTLVYISSVAALGRNNKNIPVTEDAEWKDGPHLTNYSRSKHMAEREVWRGREEGLQVVVVNPTIVLGIGDFTRSSAEIFSRVNGGLPFYPPGSNGFVAVQDVVAACFHLLENRHFNRRFILCGEHRSFQSLFEEIASALQVRPPKIAANRFYMQVGRIGAWVVQLISRKKAFITRESIRNAGKNHRYDTSRITQETGFAFTPLSSVIAETATYLKALNVDQSS